MSITTTSCLTMPSKLSDLNWAGASRPSSLSGHKGVDVRLKLPRSLAEMGLPRRLGATLELARKDHINLAHPKHANVAGERKAPDAVMRRARS